MGVVSTCPCASAKLKQSVEADAYWRKQVRQNGPQSPLHTNEVDDYVK